MNVDTYWLGRLRSELAQTLRLVLGALYAVRLSPQSDIRRLGPSSFFRRSMPLGSLVLGIYNSLCYKQVPK